MIYLEKKPKDLIRDTLITEIGDIVPKHAYLSFLLICSGIEFLGKCLDDKCSWERRSKSQEHFERAIYELFPEKYHHLKTDLYKELRCGMLHSLISGSFRLTEVSNLTFGTINYGNHLIIEERLLVIDYYYQDFVIACNKVIDKPIPPESKMGKTIMLVGPFFKK